MGGDTELRVLVHLARADLHLDALALRPDDGRVDRAITVVLRSRDVVVELTGDVGPQAMGHTERRVAVRNRRHHYAHGAQVKELLEGKLLALHLLVDAVDVLGAPIDLRFDARRQQLPAQRRAQRFDVAFAIRTPLIERGGDATIFVRLQIAKREVFQLPLDLPHAEAIRQRSEDGPRLYRETLPLLRRQLARVAQADQLLRQPRNHEARVADYRQQHLAQRLGLTCVEAACGGPVTREPQLPESQQSERDLRSRGSDDARELLGSEPGPADDRPHQHGLRQIAVLRERAHDLGRLSSEGEIGRRQRTGLPEGQTGIDDRVTDRRRTELIGLHGTGGTLRVVGAG